MLPPHRLIRRYRSLAALWVVAVLPACGDGRGGVDDDADIRLPGKDSVAAIDTASPEATIAPPREAVGNEELLDAKRVLESYYAAIREGSFRDAYLLWADSGRASGQTAETFRDGYAETVNVELETGEGRLEGAAGSRYAEFPVRILATTRDGATQRFEGRYVLRRSVVDGASEDQRAWRIYSADVRQVP